MSSLKVCVVGPKGTCKSVLSNFLAGQSEKLAPDNYEPTAGVRILECEVPSPSGGAASVEIWDASGDHAYEACWRAIMDKADGVVLVYNPDAPSQDQQIADWFDFFVRKNGLRDEQCMVIAHRVGQQQSSERFRPPPIFSKVTSALTTPASGPELKTMFSNFVRDISSMKVRK